MSKKFFTYKGKDYDFGKIVVNFTEVQKQIPEALATVCVNYFKDSFRRQGWRDSGRGILIKRGHLRNSIRRLIANWKRVEVGTDLPYAEPNNEGFSGTVSVRQHTRRQFKKERYKVGRGVYSVKTRQELTRTKTQKVATGTTFTVRAHTRKVDLPQRQFIGDSEVLEMKIDQTITRAVDTIFEL